MTLSPEDKLRVTTLGQEGRFKISEQELADKSENPKKMNELFVKLSLKAMSEGERLRSNLNRTKKNIPTNSPHQLTADEMKKDLDHALIEMQQKLAAEGFELFTGSEPQTEKPKTISITPEQIRSRQIGEFAQQLMISEPEFKKLNQEIADLFSQANIQQYLSSEKVLNINQAQEIIQLKKIVKALAEKIIIAEKQLAKVKEKIYGNKELQLSEAEEKEILKLLTDYVKLNDTLKKTPLRTRIVEKNIDLRDYLKNNPNARLEKSPANRVLKKRIHDIEELKDQLRQLAA